MTGNLSRTVLRGAGARESACLPDVTNEKTCKNSADYSKEFSLESTPTKSKKKIKIGIPRISPHTPKKCSPNTKMINVMNVGKFVLDDMSFGFNT